jgi:hypothetical protein
MTSHPLFAGDEPPLSLPSVSTLPEGKLLFVYKLGRMDTERLIQLKDRRLLAFEGPLGLACVADLLSTGQRRS